MKRLENKTAVVTGGGHGIGRASALRLASEGARVAILDLNQSAADETAELIVAAGGQALALAADVTNESQVVDAIGTVAEHFGTIDILHSNAGVIFGGTALTQTLDEWNKTFAVNVTGVFLTAKAVLPFMLKQGSGAIVNTASTSGMVGEPGLVAYNSSKAAVVNFTRQLASDFSRSNIRINSVCPGWILATGFNDPALEDVSDSEVDQMIDQWVPAGRAGTAEEVAAGVAFLASDDASYITGHALLIDGGMTAQ